MEEMKVSQLNSMKVDQLDMSLDELIQKTKASVKKEEAPARGGLDVPLNALLKQSKNIQKRTAHKQVETQRAHIAMSVVVA